MAESTIYPALGNHDMSHANYFNFFELPNNERWYSWDYGKAHFIVLEVDGYESVAPDSWQYWWLENDLSRVTKTWKFVFFHIPLYSCGLLGGPDLEARAALHPLFREHGVDIVFNGHSHNYQRHVVDGVTYIVTGGGAGVPGAWRASATTGPSTGRQPGMWSRWWSTAAPSPPPPSGLTARGSTSTL